MNITIGKTETGAAFVLPPDLVTSTVIVYGGKGMGKTNLGSVLVEELTAAHLRWSVLDPMGVWWGLRHSKDGKGPGIECLILGGPHGDIPIEPTGGAVAADLVVDEDANVIIDFSRKPNGETWGVGEKIRFVSEYGRRLFQRQGSTVDGRRRDPIFQVLDEAARYVPQMIRAGQPEIAMCASVWAQIVEEGRNNGIGVGLLTQRSARLNKDVAELADVMVAFRTVGPNSIDALMDWLGEHVPKEQIRKQVEIIRSVPRGTALVVSPGWLQFEGIVQIRERETFDSSATPKPGERARKVSGQAAKPDLSKYAERMRDTIERAKESDPQELKRRIADLTRELATARRVQPPSGITDEVLRDIVAESVAKSLSMRDEEWRRSLQEFRLRIREQVKSAIAEALIAAIDTCEFKQPAMPKVSAEVEVKRSGSPKTAGTLRKEVAESPVQRGAVPHTAPRQLAESNGNVTESQRKILAALATFEAIGRFGVSKKWIAALAGASHTSSTYGNNLGALRTAGLIEYPQPGAVGLTVAGRALAPAVDVPSTSDEMLQRCKQIVTAPQAAILEELHRAYPDSLDKSVIAERVSASATSSSYGNNLGALRSAGMIDYPAPGKVKAADWLFLE